MQKPVRDQENDRYDLTVKVEKTFLSFMLDDLRFAVPVTAAVRVFRAVLITPLPGAPDSVLGAVDINGAVVPVVDIRGKVGLLTRAPALTDHFLRGRTSKREIVLVTSGVEGITTCNGSNLAQARLLVPGLKYIGGILKDDRGLILIQDLEELLSKKEEKSVREALERARHV